jgi:hypothetical protein
MSISIQITPQGLHRSRTLLELRGELRKTRALVLRQFLHAALLQRIQSELTEASFSARIYEDGIGQEQLMEENPAWNLLHFLMNDTELLKMLRQVTDSSQVGFFSGRIYKLEPGQDHHLDWHNDVCDSRLYALSLNLSSKQLRGGALQIRDAKNKKIHFQSGRLEPGDAVLFKIGPELEHCIGPVEGRQPRIAYAGWFYPSSEAKWFSTPKVLCPRP